MKFWLLAILLAGLLGLSASAQSVLVVDIEGLFRRINTNSDSLYVVNFWATWCKPCVEELPDFQAVQSEMKGKPVVFLYVSLDFKSQLNSRVLPFLKKQPLQEVLLLSSGNPDAWINRVSEEWSGAIPATLFWKQGRKKHFHEGSYTREALRLEVMKE